MRVSGEPSIADRPAGQSEVDDMCSRTRTALIAQRSFGLRFTRRHVDLVRVSSALCSY
jgi:hypothetical protein